MAIILKNHVFASAVRVYRDLEIVHYKGDVDVLYDAMLYCNTLLSAGAVIFVWCIEATEGTAMTYSRGAWMRIRMCILLSVFIGTLCNYTMSRVAQNYWDDASIFCLWWSNCAELQTIRCQSLASLLMWLLKMIVRSLYCKPFAILRPRYDDVKYTTSCRGEKNPSRERILDIAQIPFVRLMQAWLRRKASKTNEKRILSHQIRWAWRVKMGTRDLA